jgi:hypothetical protein
MEKQEQMSKYKDAFIKLGLQNITFIEAIRLVEQKMVDELGAKYDELTDFERQKFEEALNAQEEKYKQEECGNVIYMPK